MAKKPVVNGPGLAEQQDREGEREHRAAPREAPVGREVVVPVAPAADEGDHPEAAEHQERVGEEVVERSPRRPCVVAACRPRRMKPAWLIEE